MSHTCVFTKRSPGRVDGERRTRSRDEEGVPWVEMQKDQDRGSARPLPAA